MSYGFRIYENGSDLKTLSMRDDLAFISKGRIRKYLRDVSYDLYAGEIATVPNAILDFVYNNNLDFTILGSTSDSHVKCVIDYTELNKNIREKKRPLQFTYMLLSNVADYNQHLSRIHDAREIVSRFYIILV